MSFPAAVLIESAGNTYGTELNQCTGVTHGLE